MTDEIETKLLKEIERIENKPRVAGELTHSSTIPTLKERLSQHRQTKKWIKGLIEFIENNSDVDEEGFKLLKKQIHGLDGCNGSKSKKAISHSSGEGNGK